MVNMWIFYDETDGNYNRSWRSQFNSKVVPLALYHVTLPPQTTGNVYSMEAITELNIKSKNMLDLLDSKPFTKADIITIQVTFLLSEPQKH